MTKQGDYELSDVPWLMRRGINGGFGHARMVLMDACEALMDRAEREQRALTGDERRAFDLHALQIRGINAEMEHFKRERIEGLAAMGIDASEIRSPF
jgi:hypothetical protein